MAWRERGAKVSRGLCLNSSKDVCELTYNRTYRGIVNHTAKQGYRADLRQEAVARASAIRESYQPKKQDKEPKLRGSKAKKAEEKTS